MFSIVSCFKGSYSCEPSVLIHYLYLEAFLALSFLTLLDSLVAFAYVGCG